MYAACLKQLPTEKNVIKIDKTFQAQKLIKFAFWGMLENFYCEIKVYFFLFVLSCCSLYDGNMFLLFLSIFIFTARSVIIFVWKIYKNSVNLFSNPYETIFYFFWIFVTCFWCSYGYKWIQFLESSALNRVFNRIIFITKLERRYWT